MLKPTWLKSFVAFDKDFYKIVIINDLYKKSKKVFSSFYSDLIPQLRENEICVPHKMISDALVFGKDF